MSEAQSYLWDFGDGRKSTEPSPVHVYQMPGIYHGKLTLTDENGNTFVSTFVIRAYDWDLADEGGVHATYTNKCYRAAVVAKQGSGIVEWGGDDWVWPEGLVGTCKGLSRDGTTVALVLNRKNGRFYQVGIPELWQDRVSSYGGSEIPCRLRIKEHLARAGEMMMIEHRETHITIRPYSEDYRGQPGYTDDGLRDTQNITLKIFKDGEQNTPWAKVQNAPIYGDLMYGKRPKGKRLQAEIETTSSGFRITEVQQIHENCDERVGPKYAVSAESNWQREFATPDLWLCRNRQHPLRNRGTGFDLVGAYATLPTGPDGIVQSAIAVSGTPIQATLPMIQNGTLGIWLGLMGMVGGVWKFPQFEVSVVSIGGTYLLRITNGVWIHDQALTWNGYDWVFLAISFGLQYIKVYENGALKVAIPRPAGLVSFGGVAEVATGMVASIFDVRRAPREISASALSYYYDNVVNGGGDILPMQR